MILSVFQDTKTLKSLLIDYFSLSITIGTIGLLSIGDPAGSNFDYLSSCWCFSVLFVVGCVLSKYRGLKILSASV